MLYLLDASITLPETVFGSGLNALGNIVKWIVEIVPNVGLGIILFTLILKLITLPLDIYSKSSMRKNSLKMEKMRPQLEKLQKQYANDQSTYNAKMMEMYKKNGYSMFGACLPMIVTLVIFMVVLGAFSDYSSYTNVDVYRKMAVKYNEAVLTYAPDLTQTQPLSVTYSTSTEGNSEGKFTCTRKETYEQEDKLIRVVLTRTLVLDEGTDYEKEELWTEVEGKAQYYVLTDRYRQAMTKRSARRWKRSPRAKKAKTFPPTNRRCSHSRPSAETPRKSSISRKTRISSGSKTSGCPIPLIRIPSRWNRVCRKRRTTRSRITSPQKRARRTDISSSS